MPASLSRRKCWSASRGNKLPPAAGTLCRLITGATVDLISFLFTSSSNRSSELTHKYRCRTKCCQPPFRPLSLHVRSELGLHLKRIHVQLDVPQPADRKSTRLNSSH